MGKRELLLVVGFLILGVVVYQATSAPAGPDQRGLFASFSRLVDSTRREMRGNRAVAERTAVSSHAIDESVTELRISEYVREVHVSGEDRADVEASLHVRSNAYDDREARETADATVLLTERAASSLLMRIDYPDPGRQHVTLRVKVPARLHVRIESRPDTLAIADVASVEAANAGGTTTIQRIPGQVVVSHQSGAATIEDVSSLRFTGRRSRLTVRDVRGEADVQIDQGGSVAASGLAGRIAVQSRNAEVLLTDPAPTSGPVRIDAVGGSVAVEGLGTEARIDSRNARVDVTMRRAAPVAIYSAGGPVALTPPPSAYTLDLVATNGRITPDNVGAELGLETTRTPSEERAAGPVGGGGPTITIRATRADVALRRPQ